MLPPFSGYEILDLVRRSGSTKQKSDLMMTLAQVPTVGGESHLVAGESNWRQVGEKPLMADSMDVGESFWY